MPIRLMSPQVAAKIAAGEVVERPASVVKELVENALDAGATQIEVEVKNGGLQLIRVTDDGAGIPSDELPLAFERHATSKLWELEDLQSILSMGFRGEALPSIASVAQVLCVSRPHDADRAAYIRLEGGHAVEQGFQGAPFGTTVFVRDIFQNVPARLKFLKSASTEGTAVVRTVSHIALAFPDVTFRLIVNGRLMFHSPGNGDVRDALVEAFGLETAQSLVLVETGHWAGLIQVSGFVSPASLTRARRDQQAFYVNRRWVQSRMLSHAVDDFYRNVLPRGRYAVAVLYITLPPADVDVNVHPAKAEVRFRRSGEVFSALHRALQATWSALDPTFSASSGEDPQGPTPIPSLRVDEGAPRVQSLFDLPTASSRVAPGEPAKAAPALILRPVGQVGVTYIVAEGSDGMYLIDQHAAHERLAFDKLMKANADKAVDVQGLLEPLAVSLNRTQRATLEDAATAMESFGFQWEPFGEGAVLLRGVPTGLRDGEAEQTFVEALDGLAQEEGPTKDRGRAIAALVACHSTVRAGQVMTFPEMDSLLRWMTEAGFPRLCPHGRPTMMHLPAAQIDRNFLRR